MAENMTDDLLNDDMDVVQKIFPPRTSKMLKNKIK
jgi:hypothetical protein